MSLPGSLSYRASTMRLVLLMIVLAATACRATRPGGCSRGMPFAETSGTRRGSSAAARHFGGARPALVIASENAAKGLLLALHGYGDDGESFVQGLGLPALALSKGLVLVAPDGTRDPRGSRFWNATDACCDFFDRPVDDVAYLRGLLAEVTAAFHVDARRRYVLGLSNGAFMAHRLACDAADDIAAIVPIAGTTAADPSQCRPSSPVSVLQVHGDADRVVLYQGGQHVLGLGKGLYPGSVATVERWARLDNCSGSRVPVPPALDLDRAPGAETSVEQVAGCPPGVDVRLLTLRGGPHVPAFTAAFGDWSTAWLEAHPKVAPSVSASGAR